MNNKEELTPLMFLMILFTSGLLIMVGILFFISDEVRTSNEIDSFFCGFGMILGGISLICTILIPSIQSQEFRVWLAKRVDQKHRFIPKKDLFLNEDEFIHLAPNVDFIYTVKKHQGVIRQLKNEGADYYYLFTSEILERMKENEPLSFYVLVKKGLNTEGFSIFKKIRYWKKLCKIYERSSDKSERNAYEVSELSPSVEIKEQPLTHTQQLQTMLRRSSIPVEHRIAIQECLKVVASLEDESMKKRCETHYFPEFLELLRECDASTDPQLLEKCRNIIERFTENLKIREKEMKDQRKKEVIDVQLSVLDSMMKMDGLVEDEIQKQIHETDTSVEN